ncbi:MAG TPA: hypothetical protein VF807_01545 [Ktedonobacterales bacterium]
MGIGQQRQSRPVGVRHLARAVALLLALPLFIVAITQAPVAHADSGSMTIVLPAPASGVSSGPVGTNVSIKGTGIGGHHYQLGVTTGATCDGDQTMNGVAFTADGSGAFALTFSWPADFNGVGTVYRLCADDTTTQPAPAATPSPTPTPFPSIMATQRFRVMDGLAPTISLSPVAPSDSTPVPTPPSGSYFASGKVQVSGAHYLGNSPKLKAYLLTDQRVDPGTLQNAAQLTTVNGLPITPNADGSFVTTLTLPNSPTGNLFIAVVSSDGTASLLPSLVDTVPITVVLAPTAGITPTVTNTPPVKVSPTPSHTSGGISGDQIIGICGLGGLSIVLFILGVVLLAGANAQRPRLLP